MYRIVGSDGSVSYWATFEEARSHVKWLERNFEGVEFTIEIATEWQEVSDD